MAESLRRTVTVGMDHVHIVTIIGVTTEEKAQLKVQYNRPTHTAPAILAPCAGKLVRDMSRRRLYLTGACNAKQYLVVGAVSKLW